MSAIPVSPFVHPEIFQPDVMQMDNKWFPLAKIGNVRPLLFDITNGGWISILKAECEGTIQRHRHAAPVTAFTLEGAWGYRERDWIARAGSFIVESAGDIHTLYVDPAAGKMTTIFHVYGPVIHIDAEGNIEEYEDVFTRLERYTKHCREVGLGDEWVRSLIR